MLERQREAGECHDDALAPPRAALRGARVEPSASEEWLSPEGYGEKILSIMQLSITKLKVINLVHKAGESKIMWMLWIRIDLLCTRSCFEVM